MRDQIAISLQAPAGPCGYSRKLLKLLQFNLGAIPNRLCPDGSPAPRTWTGTKEAHEVQ
jgi:hypothetical protein